MPDFYAPNGNPEIWDKKPEGYFTPEEWNELHPPQEPEFNPGPDYEKRGDDWWKVRFSVKDFRLHCGFEQCVKLKAASRTNDIAGAVSDFLSDSEYIDVTDPATVQMVQLLTTAESGNVLAAEDAARILQGEKHVEDVPSQT